jgi:homoserine O-acetyltransferase
MLDAARTMLGAGSLIGCTLLACSLVGCSPPSAPAPRTTPSVPTVVTGAGEGDQRIAELGTCTLDSGEKIEECRIGYRTFGKLDAKRSNVVLFPTWFTGTTKDLVDDVPGKLVDTKRFFLVLVDALGNGVSSGPSTSRTQPRLRFPKFTIHDMVETQRRLVREVIGAQKVHTVMGISMGGMQAFEWAVSHPDEVGRIVPIVGTPQLTTQDLLLWNAELHLLQGSTAYANGQYEGRPRIRALQELHWLMLTTPSHRNAETSRAAFPAWVETKANDTKFDWNDWHRQLEAMLAHDVARRDGGDLSAAAKRVKAKALVIVAEHDMMVNPAPSKVFADAMNGDRPADGGGAAGGGEGRAGSNATFVSLDTPCGHMAPACDATLGPRIQKFMAE